MRTLYHQWLCPFARKVRLALKEKKLDFELEEEPVWEAGDDFLALNPAGEVPVLVEPDGTALSDSVAICEYLEDTFRAPKLLPDDPLARAEARRLVAWFDHKMYREVTRTLIVEKADKRLRGGGVPDSGAIRKALAQIHGHLAYIGWLAERRRWLGGAELSLADLAAAGQVSAIDYLGDVPWDEYPGAKDWYVRIKSRPSFRPLLADFIPGMGPAKHYANLDF
ncbi:MAG: glutathione S-transferase family protein [Alphaproteobacteria bacterium]|nr:glutathione S-transferase family protein [Alphaproteobacteria bacterium]